MRIEPWLERKKVFVQVKFVFIHKPAGKVGDHGTSTAAAPAPSTGASAERTWTVLFLVPCPLELSLFMPPGLDRWFSYYWWIEIMDAEVTGKTSLGGWRLGFLRLCYIWWVADAFNGWGSECFFFRRDISISCLNMSTLIISILTIPPMAKSLETSIWNLETTPKKFYQWGPFNFQGFRKEKTWETCEELCKNFA